MALRIRLCFLCSAVLIQNLVHAQSPFNYGKNKNIYFFSRNDMLKHQVRHIYTIAESPENRSWSFFDIDFAGLPDRYYNKFCDAHDDGSKPPSLDSLLLDTVNYVNAKFYSFRDNKIEQEGMGGMGALCHSNYEFYKGYSIAEEACKYEMQTSSKKIVYFPNGLVNYKTCCEEVSLEETPVLHKAKYKDTTYYVYDSQKRIAGYKKHKRQSAITPIFKGLKRQQFETNLKIYVNRVSFEDFIDRVIGYRPKLILFEIYTHAVLPFQYDSESRQYVELEDIHLE
jgi:hypothetical protein